MKHYLSYDKDGCIVGVHTYHDEATKLGGWPESARVEHEDTDYPVAANLRAQIVGGPTGAVAIMPYYCGCSPTKLRCQCAAHRLTDSRVVRGAIVPKLTGALVVDGGIVPANSVVKRPPGASIKMKAVSAGIADGSSVIVEQSPGVAVLEEDKLTLVFTGGETGEFTVVAPAQGSTGAIRVSGLDFITLIVMIRGWSVVA